MLDYLLMYDLLHVEIHGLEMINSPDRESEPQI